MIVGHNPGLQDLTLMLAAGAAGDELTQVKDKFPTAALAQIDFPTDDWATVERHGGTLSRFVTPRTLAAATSG